ncbi:flagellar hook protein [Deferribacter autotrophicus]|uniref:Flagellar hook-associated protein 2 n=1 Tax=Deferribacter autotrophicus TaxID=500465 RepID=A0A5A8F3L3_9BACT|nr:flagellar filament capping protein FliD [Deferribacter autotrophicus]KAA0258051.1 flagellar hook protein [Deferribacter autotrophicus]
MDALRIGGIMSGLDTNGIVDTLVKQARIPIEKLQGQYDLKTLEKNVFQEISTDLVNLKTDLLSLKLESTFKSMTATSSNTSILTATASTSASVGSHTIKVNNLAQNAYWYSNYTFAKIVESGAGVTSLTGRPSENIEGLHNISISSDGTRYLAHDSIKLLNQPFVQKISGTSIANVDDFGDLTADESGTLSFTYQSTVINVSVNAVTGDSLNKIAQQIQDGLNNEINIIENTTDIQYVAVKAQFDGTNWSLAIYKTRVTDYNLTIDSSSPSTLITDLGLDTTTTSNVNSIDNYIAAVDLAGLESKINDSNYGLIAGVTLNTESGLTEGNLQIVQDATLSTGYATKTKILGNTVSSGSGLNVTAIGLQNAGFLKTVDSNTNGTFTINGVKITIEDYTSISVNDLLAKINSSGAGVTAYYDSDNDRIVLEANETGGGSISLGDFSDTSNILSILRLSVAEGAKTDYGTTDGSVDPTEKLSNSNFNTVITSGIITINGVSIYVDAENDSLNDVFYKINNSGAGVTISYDQVSDKVYIKSNDVDKITFGSVYDTSNLLEVLNLTNNTTTEKELGFEGEYASVTVDGIDYIRKTNKIDDIIPGVTLNLQNASTESVTVNVSVDTTKAVESIASFISHYNALVEKLNPPELDDEDKEYLEPLTDDDKATMSDEEVKQYEENWKKFNTYEIIRKSSEIRSLKLSLRSNLLSEITGLNGKYNSLVDIGLDIAGDGNIEIEKKGYLLIDSTDYEEIKKKLEENTTFINALKDNPEDVYKLFAVNDGDTQGWARRYESIINQYVSLNGLIDVKIRPFGTIDRELYTLAKQIDAKEMYVESYLNRLWQKFSNMEKVIADLQAQGSYLQQLITQG